ncbi:WD repeat-containing protein RUP2-like [Lolium rigidum]|uniref:WD repeat-containing protein RUP2-like n=1 Tax=Lolium rigidum TaxID=89674 RepID=UPI001F5C3AFA|nr:WD repeat-containing protein RUP2-like [Lolium rigidum]
MTNPSSPSSPPSTSRHQRRRHSQEANDDDEVDHGITFPARPEEDDELSPPRLEWDFRLAATVPSPALAGASDAIGSVDFDPAGRLLATGGIARKVRIYTVADFLHPPTQSTSSSCSPAACICVPAKLSSVRWRPEGGAVGCGDYDGVVTEYDAERGVASWERDEHAGRRVWALDYAPHGASMAASGSDDRTAHVWDPRAPSGTSWATARAGGAVLCVEFDPSGGPQLAVGSADRRAAVYDVRALGHGAVACMDGHARAVTYVRWAPARRVVTSAADGTHRLWEWPAATAVSGPAREVRSYSGHVSGRSFVGMGLWRGAGLVASGSESNHVFVYDLRWAKPVWVHPFGLGDGDAGGGFVSAVAWRQGDADAGGGALVAGRSDGVLKMFTCQRRTTDNPQVDDQ